MKRGELSIYLLSSYRRGRVREKVGVRRERERKKEREREREGGREGGRREREGGKEGGGGRERKKGN